MSTAINELAWLGCLFLGAVFTVSGVLKLRRVVRFRDSLASMELIPLSWISPVAWCLIVVEIALALSLLTTRAPRATGAMAIGLLGLFVIVLGWYRLRGNRKIACGCFADFERKTQTMHLIIRNALLIVFAVPLLLVERVSPPGWSLAAWLLSLFTLAGLCVAWSGVLQIAEMNALRRLEIASEQNSDRQLQPAELPAVHT